MDLKGKILFLMIVLGLGGCGTTTGSGASAPPISLPAPVTGRMTVAGPDESGVALVVGDEGAVPAGAVVHAINGSKETVTLRFIEMGLSWIPEAHAQTTLPEVCNRTFHACALAGSDGSFEISILAAEDEEIVVEILDPTSGQRISERFRRPVPRNVHHFVRPVADLGLLANTVTGDHNLYVLMPRTVEDPQGRVAIVDLDTNTGTVVPFAGPNPARMAVQTETRLAAIVDPEGQLVSKIDLTTNNFDSPLPMTMDKPEDVVFNTTGTEILVANSIESSGPAAIFLQKIDVTAMVGSDELNNSDLSFLVPGTINVETKALDLISFTTTGTFDLVAFIGTYKVGGVNRPAVGLANGSSLKLLALTFLPDGTVPEDVAFDRTADRVLVTDSGNDKILLLDFTTTAPLPSPLTTLTLAGEVVDPTGELLVNPRDIVVHPTNGFAFVNAKNGTEARPDTVLTVNLAIDSIVDINPVGLGPSGSIFDPIDQRLFVSTHKSRAVTFWDLADLLP